MSIPDNVTPLDQARPENDRAWNEKKKERTRGQLTEAASRLIARRGLDNVTINDIATEAAVAPGTFYNYFPALDVLHEELATGLVQAIGEVTAARSRVRDPGARIARVLRGVMARSRENPDWACLLVQFATRVQFPVQATLLRSVEDDIIDGIGKGQFVAEADEAAPDLVTGALMAGVLRAAGGHVGRDYEVNLVSNILRGLGMVSAAALERSQRGI